MPKVQLNDLSSLANETSAIAVINLNNAAIEEGFNNTISRDGTSPNTLEAQIDMNQNRIVNVPTVPLSNTDVASKYYVDFMTGQTSDQAPTNPNDAVIEGDLDVGGDLTVDGSIIGDVTTTGDIFLASGKKIDWNAADVTITHAANSLAFAGGSSGYTFDSTVRPTSNDGAALGSSTVNWSDLFLASGGVINFNNSALTLTHDGTRGLTLNGSGGQTVLSITAGGNAGIEIGRQDNTLSTPFIDFHSGSTSVDYDSRLIATGGTGVNAGGTLTFEGSIFRCSPNDKASLGESGTAWSDLFLSSGAVINFNAGDVTVTHSANTLAFAGATSGYTFDTPINVSSGGSGRSTATAYRVICGGTTDTGAHQSVGSIGTSGQVLTSQGTGALPTWSTPSGSIINAVTSGTISSAATLDITLSTADMYEIDLINIAPATDAQIFHMRFSQSSSFLSGASDYAWGGFFGTNDQDQADDSIQIGGTLAIGNSTNEKLWATIRIFRPSASGFTKAANWFGGGWNSTPNIFQMQGVGSLIANTNAIDGVRFLFGSGNIASGFYAVRSYSFS